MKNRIFSLAFFLILIRVVSLHSSHTDADVSDNVDEINKKIAYKIAALYANRLVVGGWNKCGDQIFASCTNAKFNMAMSACWGATCGVAAHVSRELSEDQYREAVFKLVSFGEQKKAIEENSRAGEIIMPVPEISEQVLVEFIDVFQKQLTDDELSHQVTPAMRDYYLGEVASVVKLYRQSISEKTDRIVDERYAKLFLSMCSSEMQTAYRDFRLNEEEALLREIFAAVPKLLPPISKLVLEYVEMESCCEVVVKLLPMYECDDSHAQSYWLSKVDYFWKCFEKSCIKI